MTDYTLAPLPVCGEPSYLPEHLVAVALAFAAPGAVEVLDVDRELRCVLQAHTSGDHRALVVELPGRDTGSVWTHWNPALGPDALAKRPDCPAAIEEEVCCAYTGHPGAHTYELTDPWGAFMPAAPHS